MVLPGGLEPPSVDYKSTALTFVRRKYMVNIVKVSVSLSYGSNDTRACCSCQGFSCLFFFARHGNGG